LNIEIRETTKLDYEDIIKINRGAFKNYGEEEIVTLVTDLLEDETGKPIVSLIAFLDGKPVGHIIFTKAKIDNVKNNLLTYILAPLGVVKEYQKLGIGGKLINEGIKRLKELKTDVVFVLGHLDYYPKYGFIKNAIKKIGYEATYDIPEEYYDGWMYMPLISMEEIKQNPGRVICADTMNKKAYWVE
jgi:putative acetyltransferase